jgi:hypothetical protein
MHASVRPEAWACLNARAPACCYAYWLATPACVLCAPHMLLLGPCVVLLRLHERACAWGMAGSSEIEGGSTACIPMLTLAACPTVGDQA